MRRANCLQISLLLVLASSLVPSFASADTTVWTGLTKSFSKAGFADSTNPVNWDQITSLVALTRAETGGVFNPLAESAYDLGSSPGGTAWATDLNNPGKTISATNWADLNFDVWVDAYGGQFQAGNNVAPTSGPPRDAVLYLIDEDIYLDIRFTEWGQGRGAGGNFAYMRAQAIPEPAAGLLAVVALVGFGAVRRVRFPSKAKNP